MPNRTLLIATVLLGLGATAAARAQPATPPNIDTVAAPATTGKTDENVTAAAPSVAGALGRFGDPGGIRAKLARKGVTYDLTYIGDTFANPTGGIKQGASYLGRLDANLNLDLARLAGAQGLSVHTEVFQIHGRGLSGNNTLDLFGVSGIETLPDTRIYELWLEQAFRDGKVSLRVGQIAADTEFVISQTAAVFIGASYGWPGSFGNNLPNGGPVYPLAATGVRLKAEVNDHLKLFVAAFDGDPGGNYSPNNAAALPRLVNTFGLGFRISDPPFVIGEAQYSYNQGRNPSGLPGVAKIGYFHHFERFAATDRPLEPGVTYRGDDGVYAILDQTIYREAADPQHGAAMFVRATYQPGDRNLIDLYVDSGIAYKGLLPGRSDDTAGLDFAFGRISPPLTRGDILLGAAPLIRDYQLTVEATYQIAVAPGLTVQPDVQYIFHPSAHAIAVPATGRPLPDALVLGVRGTIHY